MHQQVVIEKNIMGLLTSVQVNNNLETGGTSPADSLVQVGQLAIDVGVALQGRKSPVADGDTDMVHASGGDLVEVTLVDEGAPVLVQDSPALIGTIDGT